jgi:hypothetical protein
MGEVQLPLNSDLNWHQNADAVLAKLGADDQLPLNSDLNWHQNADAVLAKLGADDRDGLLS